jgi:hypothetical protein
MSNIGARQEEHSRSADKATSSGWVSHILVQSEEEFSISTMIPKIFKNSASSDYDAGSKRASLDEKTNTRLLQEVFPISPRITGKNQCARDMLKIW